MNTVDPRHAADRREYLTSYAALLDWAQSLGSPMPAAPAELSRMAVADPTAAGSALSRALELRESLYVVLAAARRGESVDAGDLAVINAQLCRATDHHVLQPADGGGVRDGWVGAESLDSPLWPVLIDAWDLLTTDLIGRIRECPGEDGACGWLFLDTSRSGTRRWCDMRTCGNRAKVRTHYTRQKDGS